MSSYDAAFFQLHSLDEGSIFVIEPVFHANAGLNASEDQWAALGMCILAPDEEMTSVMHLTLS